MSDPRSQSMPLPPSARLAAEDVRVVRGGRDVLSVPHLALLPDETVAIIGPNGAGKSTLLQALGLLHPLAAGTISVDGRPVSGRAAILAARRRMAMVFQEPLLFDTTVTGNVASGLKIRGAHPRLIEERVDYWLAALGIGHLARRQATELSGGEAQRVSLARALALDPDILLLDEPFAALDAATRAALLDEIERLLRRPGRLVVAVTHDRAEALRLADRIGVILNGEVVQLDVPATVFGAPASPAVAAFVGVETILPGLVVAVHDGLATVAVGHHRLLAPSSLPAGQPVHVCLRPEDVALVRPGDGAALTSVRNHLEGRVRRVTPLGPLVRVDIDAGVPLLASVTRHALDDLQLAPGVTVVAAVKASAVHLIPVTAANPSPSAAGPTGVGRTQPTASVAQPPSGSPHA